MTDFPWEIFEGHVVPEFCTLDKHHLQWLWNIVEEQKPKNCLEIGCHKGYSTQVFLVALMKGLIKGLTIVDIQESNFVPELLAKCEGFEDKVTYYRGDSLEFIKEKREFELAFVDGDHRPDHVIPEVNYLVENGTEIICLHDSNLSNLPQPYQDQTGALLAKNLLQGTEPFYCLEDNVKRPGEQTERGFFVAFRGKSRLEKSRKSFRGMNGIEE